MKFTYQCGERNKQLGGNETFYCKKCEYETHRDVNVTRNILLKYFNIFHFSVQKMTLQV